MGRSNPVGGGSGDELSRIKKLAAQLHENSCELKKSGKWTVGQASDHVKIHKQFEKALGDLHQHEIGKKLPADIDVVQILDESCKLIGLFQSVIDGDYESGSSGENSPTVSTTSQSPSESDEPIESAGIYGMNLEEIEGVLRSLPSMTEKQLPKDTIQEAFEKEVEDGSTLKGELEKIVTDLGVDIKDISSADLKVLVSCLMVNRNITRTTTKEKAQSEIFKTLLPYVSGAIKAEKDYSKELQKFQKENLKESLITEKTASTIDEETGLSVGELMFLQSKIGDKGSLFNESLDEKISSLLASRFSHICHHLKGLESPESNLEEVERSVIDAMGILNCLSKNLPVNDETEELWINLYESYHEILSIKMGSSETVQDVIANVFQQFETFIEDGILTYLLINGGGSPEHVSQRIYGRTEAQMEKIKVRNRRAAAEKIVEFSEKIKAGSPITVEMLSELHRVNNKGIVPKIASELRKDVNKFGRRVGVVPEDAILALSDIFARANQILTRDEGWGLVSYFTLSVEVAMLHNEILDIHPFIDRNGSTALLFVELMMAVKRGHTPSPKRNKSYYMNLIGILNKSALGAAVVATEHYKIAYVPGHYKSRVIELTEEKRRKYATAASLSI